MANVPLFFAFFPKDFADDILVESMTTTQVGAYILLLCKAWQADPPCTLPNDDLILAKLARLDAAKWAEVKVGVLSPFTLDAGGRWHQKRLRQEYDKAMKRSRKAQISGRLGGLARGGGEANAKRTLSERLATGIGSLERDKSPSSEREEEFLPPSGNGRGGRGGSEANAKRTLSERLANASENGHEPDTPNDFDLSPAGLAQLWCNRFRGSGAEQRDPYKRAAEFAEWLRVELLTAKQLHAEITRERRERTETTWQMKARLTQSTHQGKNGAQRTSKRIGD